MKPRHIPDTVVNCAPTRDGRHLIITRTGAMGHCDHEIPVGRRVRINNGKASEVK